MATEERVLGVVFVSHVEIPGLGSVKSANVTQGVGLVIKDDFQRRQIVIASADVRVQDRLVRVPYENINCIKSQLVEVKAAEPAQQKVVSNAKGK